MSLYNNRFRNHLPLMALLVGAAILAMPTPAHAAFSVQVYDDGVLQNGAGGTGIVTVTIDPVTGVLTYGGSTTHFKITAGNGSSNFPGDQGGTSLQLNNNETVSASFGTAGGAHTLQIVLSQTDFVAPVGTPLVLSSSGGGSIGYVGAPGHSDTVNASYQGFLDNTNTLFGMPVAGSTSLQTASATKSSFGTAPLVLSPGTAINPAVPGGTPFSITDVLTFKFTLAAGSGADTANFSGTTSTAYVAPAPAGLVLALTGLPVLGIGAWFRRRRQTV